MRVTNTRKGIKIILSMFDTVDLITILEKYLAAEKSEDGKTATEIRAEKLLKKLTE